MLKSSLLADLEIIDSSSRIKYDYNPFAISRTTSPNSIHFCPNDEDEKDEFIDLLFNELMLQGLSIEGDLEELRQCLHSELILKYKYRMNVKSWHIVLH